jgi:hypothetical protein
MRTCTRHSYITRGTFSTADGVGLPSSKLATTAAEALLLARKLNAHNVARLLRQPLAELKATLGHVRLSELVTPDGRRRATDLLIALLRRHARGGALPDSFADELRSGCPTFFPYHQQVYTAAFRELEAVGAAGTSACAFLLASAFFVVAVGLSAASAVMSHVS